MSPFVWLDTALRYAETAMKLFREFVAELQGKQRVNQEPTGDVETGGEVTQGMSAETFADRVEWEGGIFEALAYGMHSGLLKDQGSALAVKWAELEERWKDLEPLKNEIQQLLDDAWGTD